eukprot:TRINITY_DN4961_c0_g1_i7.p3 TRINITY_DN4961_c0_g1~~TRINITY_DN4961_c0_g1_i7.p3  ORF type:complete len:133 (+),score=17.30 TRINITY_DN4961_c0_g1_i7:318-716(+)
MSEPYQNNGLSPAQLEMQTDQVKQVVINWIETQSGTELLGVAQYDDGPLFLHAQFVTGMLGFVDDFFIQLTCEGDGKVLVEVQSQRRLDTYDLGTNLKRVRDFIYYLRQLQGRGKGGGASCVQNQEKSVHEK